MPLLVAKRDSRLNRFRSLTSVRSAVLAVIGIVLLGLMAWFGPRLTAWYRPPTTDPPAPAITREPDADELPTTVVLTQAKRQAAGIRAVPVEIERLQPMRRVAGTLDYNADRYLEIKAPSTGVVKQVFVAPAQQVAAGERLALVVSPTVGEARDEIRVREAALAQAKKQHEWCDSIAANVDSLVAAIDNSPPMSSIEQEFGDKLLGSYRETLLSAYSRHLLAERVAADLRSLDSGIVSGRSMQERQSGREIGRAALKSASEQARFSAQREATSAKAAVEHADRQLRIAQQQLSTLLGPFADTSELASDAEPSLCAFSIRSPLNASVAERAIVAGMQLAEGQKILTLADTSMLWAKAQVFQRDFSELAVSDKLSVTIAAPSLGIETQSSSVKFIGSRLQDETHALPLVAELDNASGRYRAGMFVWVSLPLGPKREALAVPPGALLQHERRSFVFIEQADGSFRRRDVETGVETADWIEIQSGLSPGELVVVEGAFFLKSELLLAAEVE
jgi:RND family efflux transporter MFP subunit